MEPRRQLVTALGRKDERKTRKVARLHGLFAAQSVVAPHDNAPAVARGQRDALIAREVDLAHKEAKVDKAVVEPLAHVLGVTAVQGKAHQRILVLHLGDHVGDKPYRRRFAATDAHLARERLG